MTAQAGPAANRAANAQRLAVAAQAGRFTHRELCSTGTATICGGLRRQALARSLSGAVLAPRLVKVARGQALAPCAEQHATLAMEFSSVVGRSVHVDTSSSEQQAGATLMMLRGSNNNDSRSTCKTGRWSVASPQQAVSLVVASKDVTCVLQAGHPADKSQHQQCGAQSKHLVWPRLLA